MNPLRQLQTDNKLYFYKSLKIKDKNAEVIPFHTNDSQDKLLEIIENHYTNYPDPKTRPTLFIIILKARQQGMSTATEGLFFKAITLGMPGDTPYNKNAMVISYDDDSAKAINEMSVRFYQHLPGLLKPMKRNSRGKGMIFENPTNVQAEFEKNPGLQSKFLIDTANNLYAGSGYTINYLHISELSKWEKPDETMKSLMQAVPKYNGIVIVESTANGAGDYFHTLWKAAEMKENSYIPLFLPWFSHKEYQLPFYSDRERKDIIATLDEEERQLMDLHGVTLEQLKWRRDTIKNKCNNDVDAFHQEYPSSAEEAFLMSGRPRFNTPVLSEYLAKVVPGDVGNLEPHLAKVVPGDVGNLEPHLIKDPYGYLEVWKYPIKGKAYFMGVDVARGIEPVAKGMKHGDYTVQVIFDGQHNLCAMWRGHQDPDIAAHEGMKLANWYNGALMIVEENNHGLSYINAIKELYSNIYKRTSHDKVTDITTEQLGWWTDVQSKKLAIDHMASMIREKKVGIKSKLMIGECLTYVKDAKGITNAQNGCHDDSVMAAAICLYVMQQFNVELLPISSPIAERVDTKQTYVKVNGVERHISEVQDSRGKSEEGAFFSKFGW